MFAPIATKMNYGRMEPLKSDLVLYVGFNNTTLDLIFAFVGAFLFVSML